MKLCYPCADVFTPDTYETCPRCGRVLAPAEARRWMVQWRRVARWLVAAWGS